MEMKLLREQAYEANMEISRQKLAIYTWGNASAFDPDRGICAIKPSGVAYSELSPESMVLLDLDGKIIDSTLKPSSDTNTHLVLYRNFQGLGGITHTHSPYAVAWAQARRSVPVYGTTHADYSPSEIPCTDIIDSEKLRNDYEQETGNLIVETFRKAARDPARNTMVLVAGHGPFTWGKNAFESVYHGAILEEICKIALFTLSLDPHAQTLPRYVIDKHWARKHGPAAYYGQ
jgi:L-ribulose-5-phosphate 4-epimerase